MKKSKTAKALESLFSEWLKSRDDVATVAHAWTQAIIDGPDDRTEDARIQHEYDLAQSSFRLAQVVQRELDLFMQEIDIPSLLKDWSTQPIAKNPVRGEIRRYSPRRRSP